MNAEDARRESGSGPSAGQDPAGGKAPGGTAGGGHGPGCCAGMMPHGPEVKKAGGPLGWLCRKMMKRMQAHCFGE